MIEQKPLQNKKVLVPRGEKEAKSFSNLLEKYGGIPVRIPLISFQPVKMDSRLSDILSSLNTYDWIIFTSKTAVETFLSFINTDQLRNLPKIAVIGKKTEEVLKANGLRAEFHPSQFVAESFIEEFLTCVHKDIKVLIPKGNLARDVIAESLRKNGAAVDEAIIYENYLPDESRERLTELVETKQLDILLFTSSSTVDHFMEVIKDQRLENNIKHCLIGCIGPVTEKTLKSYGLPVHASPKVYTVEEMIISMIVYLEKR